MDLDVDIIVTEVVEKLPCVLEQNNAHWWIPAGNGCLDVSVKSNSFAQNIGKKLWYLSTN
jgi:hypothetical protein